ncbi:hypothetical protein [Micromonospora sp. NPDC049274]|uniref:hypothetical protein n=1 Tax=Micromonospora sp. NPDC049274 TaxID=3154829 RepID=UPI0034490CCC
MIDLPVDPLSDRELRDLREAGIALFAGRVILNAQPPVDDATLAAVAERCAGPLPDPLVALWRTAFGGRLDYDLRADLDGQDVPLSFTELFYPDSDDYQDLWGWIGHEIDLADEHEPQWSGRLGHLPIGGFEYLDRVYVNTVAGQDHGAVVCWRHGLPAGWELRTGDRSGWLADDLHTLFGQLMLERDPWNVPEGTGAEMRDAVDELTNSADAHLRTAAAKVRRLVRQTVLDWRSALDEGTLPRQRRLRRLAMDRAVTDDDVALLARLVSLGCDPAEEISNGLTPLDLALMLQSSDATRWLLQHDVPVDNALQVGAHAVDLELARNLIDRGASVNECAVIRAVDNENVEVVRLLSNAVRPDALGRLSQRLRTMAGQATPAGRDSSAQPGTPAGEREYRRAAVLAELADRFDADRQP